MLAVSKCHQDGQDTSTFGLIATYYVATFSAVVTKPHPWAILKLHPVSAPKAGKTDNLQSVTTGTKVKEAEAALKKARKEPPQPKDRTRNLLPNTRSRWRSESSRQIPSLLQKMERRQLTKRGAIVHLQHTHPSQVRYRELPGKQNIFQQSLTS